MFKCFTTYTLTMRSSSRRHDLENKRMSKSINLSNQFLVEDVRIKRNNLPKPMND